MIFYFVCSGVVSQNLWFDVRFMQTRLKAVSNLQVEHYVSQTVLVSTKSFVQFNFLIVFWVNFKSSL
ncbi:hypothetical protein ACE6H2_023350 [Prunus campanulata]